MPAAASADSTPPALPRPLCSCRMDKFTNNWMTGKGVHYTPLGLAMIGANGTLGMTANAAMLAMLYNQYQGSRDSTNYCWARAQISYMLGDRGKSFVVGFGDQFPRKVPHRGASCPDPGAARASSEPSIAQLLVYVVMYIH
jgi:hypothetical protein